MTLSDSPDQTERTGERLRILDPCCGSGRLLLAVAEIDRTAELVGQDIDLRCARMTAINLALRNLYGYVIHGDSLRQDHKRIYRTEFNGRGFLREVAIEECEMVLSTIAAAGTPSSLPAETAAPGKQLHLF
jgi:SAM-dependent methyltransferase